MTVNRITELLDREEMSLAGAADLCGVRERTVERWIREETGIPDAQKRVLAERFSCTVEHLLGWDREPETQETAA